MVSGAVRSRSIARSNGSLGRSPAITNSAPTTQAPAGSILFQRHRPRCGLGVADFITLLCPAITSNQPGSGNVEAVAAGRPLHCKSGGQLCHSDFFRLSSFAFRFSRFSLPAEGRNAPHGMNKPPRRRASHRWPQPAARRPPDPKKPRDRRWCFPTGTSGVESRAAHGTPWSSPAPAPRSQASAPS